MWGELNLYFWKPQQADQDQSYWYLILTAITIVGVVAQYWKSSLMPTTSSGKRRELSKQRERVGKPEIWSENEKTALSRLHLEQLSEVH